MQQLKSIVDSLAHSDVAKNAYNAITSKYGSIGVAIALAVVVVVGVVVFGYDVADVQAWFAGLAE